MEKKTIGSFIAALRKANGLTQKNLAEKLNVSDKTVSRWERNESTPDLTLIPVIAEIFGVTSDELLCGERRNDEFENIGNVSSKSEKQIKNIINLSKTKFQNESIIIVAIAIIGLFVAAICNFIFYRANLGFLIECIFCVVAAFCEIIFYRLSVSAINDVDFDPDVLNEYKKSLIITIEVSLSAIFVILAMTLPTMIMAHNYRSILFITWFFYGILFGVIATMIARFCCLIANHFAVSRQLYTISANETVKMQALAKLRKRIIPTIALIIIATFLIQNCINEIIPKSFWGVGHSFDNYDDFVKYMEQTPEEYAEDYTEDEWHDINEITTDDGTLLCKFDWKNPDVVGIDYGNKRDGYLPLIAYTHEDYIQVNNIYDKINIGFMIIYIIELGVGIFIYCRKKKAINV